MSTKCSLFYSDELHLFKECLDDESVYLKINKNNLKMELCLPLEKFITVANTIDMESLEKQAAVTDEEIKEYCRFRVQRRKDAEGIGALSGMLVFGDSRSPEDQQITNGFNHYASIRDRLKRLIDKIKKTITYKYTFGLEDIIK